MILQCLQLLVHLVCCLIKFELYLISNKCFYYFLINLECVTLIKEKLVDIIGKGKDEVAGFAHYVAMYIVFGKAVSNTKSNLNDAQSNQFILFNKMFISDVNYYLLLLLF